MVTSIKDTHSVGVGLGYAEEAGDSLFRLRDGEHWFAAQTLCNRERLAFLPRFHKKVRHSRSLREVIAPVFPGYIFVFLNSRAGSLALDQREFRRGAANQRSSSPDAGPDGRGRSFAGEHRRIGSGAVLWRPQTGAARTRGRRSLRPGPGCAAAAAAKGRVQVLLTVMGRQAAVIKDQAHLTVA